MILIVHTLLSQVAPARFLFRFTIFNYRQRTHREARLDFIKCTAMAQGGKQFQSSRIVFFRLFFGTVSSSVESVRKW